LAYAALLLYMAILFVRPQEWMPLVRGFPILDWVVGLAVVTWLGHRMESDWKAKEAPQNYLMLGLFFAALMSHVRHTFFSQLIATFQGFGKVVILYFLIVSLVNSTRRARQLIFVMILGSLFQAAHAYLQWQRGYGFGGDFLEFRPVYYMGLVRVRGLGFFHDPNDLALMLVAILPFLFVKIVGRSAGMISRVTSLLACVPLVWCIYQTNSRGGWLAFGIMVLAFVYLHLRSKVFGVALAVVALLALVSLGPSRVEGLNVSDDSAHARLVSWGDGNRMLKRWPIFGAGKNRFQEFSSSGLVAHNSFVHCWAELGLFGYFFWLGLVLGSLKDGYALGKVLREGHGPAEEDEKRAEAAELTEMGRAGAASLVGFLAAALFLSRSYVLVLYVLFALLTALRVIYEKRIGELPGCFVPRDLKLVLAAELVSVPALYVFIRVMNVVT